ncbi:hypothetical protein D1AOALGA4SA_5896, partial [Olavius algarvensis Delta 1 endosymbiont]
MKNQLLKHEKASIKRLNFYQKIYRKETFPCITKLSKLRLE